MLDIDALPRKTPLWCVYGPDCFPTIFCCIIRDHPSEKNVVWGYSVYKRVPGFRTFGQSFNALDNPRFFSTQFEALDYLRQLITPKKSAVKGL